MSLPSSSAACLSTSAPAFSPSACAFTFAIASRLCAALHQAKGVAAILSCKTLGESENDVALWSAVEAATSFSPTSEFLPAPGVLDHSAVFNLPDHSWYKNLLPSVDLIRAIMSCPTTDGFLASLFTTIAPMVPAEHTYGFARNLRPGVTIVATWSIRQLIWSNVAKQAC